MIWEAKEMSYDGTDQFAKDIKQFYCEMLNMLTDNNWKKLDTDFWELIEKSIKPNKKEKWFVTLYKKHSIYKFKKIYRKD